jgi:DNA-binding response OmpR family regulator
MRIILCTANPMVSEAVTEAVRGRGTPPVVCESGLELLGAVRDAAADLALLDLDTPGLNALFLIGAIQELAPGLRVAAVSTQSETDSRSLAQHGVPFVKLNAHPEVEVRALLAELSRRSRHASYAGSAVR